MRASQSVYSRQAMSYCIKMYNYFYGIIHYRYISYINIIVDAIEVDESVPI